MTQATILKTAMTHAISSVFETMFFLPVEIENYFDFEALEKYLNGTLLSAKLTFTGKVNGTGTFSLLTKTAANITASFLGTDESDVNEQQISGTVLEILNMLVGNTLSTFSPNEVFNLSIPDLLNGDKAQARLSTENAITIVIRTMETAMAFQIAIQP